MVFFCYNDSVKAEIKKQIDALPKEPGVYYFLDAQQTILYIGKATSLRNRVQSYFSGDMMEKRGPIIDGLIAQIDTILFEQADSVLEALILESREIKTHQPAYNSKEKSQTSFSYLIITDESYPRLLIKRERDILEKRVPEKIKHSFGPFQSKRTLVQVLKILRKIFPYYSKKGSYDEKSNLYEQIGLVPGASQTIEEYQDTIEQIKLFFEGKKKTVLKILKKQMEIYVTTLEFEKAELVKRRLYALEHIQDSALITDDLRITPLESFRIEAYDIAHMFGDSMVGVMTVIKQGEPDTDQYRQFKIKSFEGIDDLRALDEVLTRRLNHTEWPYPDCIVVDGGAVHKKRIEKVLREREVSIPVIAAKKNDKHKVEAFIGQKKLIEKYKKEFLLANSESHRFAIKLHRNMRNKKTLK